MKLIKTERKKGILETSGVPYEEIRRTFHNEEEDKVFIVTKRIAKYNGEVFELEKITPYSLV